MMALGQLDVKPLITHRFALEAAADAYELLATGTEPYLGILLQYPRTTSPQVAAQTVQLEQRPVGRAIDGKPRVAFIGAGNYAGRVLIPAFAAAGATLQGIASGGGVSAAHYGRKFGFTRASSDTHALIGAEDVDVVVIATRHNTHAALAIEALAAGKHVFVEKPLALDAAQLDEIRRALESSSAGGPRLLTVGFNRRFAPQVRRMKTLLEGVREPKSFVVTVNAGAIPATHWTQDPHVGGGRIVGEACHFVDLLRFLAGAPIVETRALALGDTASRDSALLSLRFADGSWGSIHYLANGNASYPKERVEVFCAGRILQLENFRRLRGYGWPGFRRMNLWRQDKGQNACVQAFVDAVSQGSPAPIAMDELLEVSHASIALAAAASAADNARD
jgi:predicted dehydrogenase